MNTDEIFEIWDKLWRGLLRSRPLQNLTLTHAHIDHASFAGYLVKESKCAVRLPLAEWLNGWLMWHEREEGLNEQFVSFIKSNGASDDDAATIVGAQRKKKYLGLRPPREFTRIRDGDTVTMGQREWRVITAGGHSPEHASFYCEKDRILIAGDQILSHITPSVIVPLAQPDANPMKDYLDSLARFASLPPDTLVLPSHEVPFLALHTRLAQCGNIIRCGSTMSHPSSPTIQAHLRSHRKCSRVCCTTILARPSASRSPISRCLRRWVG
jgi:glyoxylase-like metal-dependent hydrolase (beta-lactamase superfamily II)